MNFAPVVLLILLGSAVSNGDDKFSVTISTNPPLSGPICINGTITFTCHIQSASKLPYHYQYQWSTDGGQPKIGDATYSMVVPSQSFVITCGVFATYEGSTQYVSKNITVQPIGTAPKIVFQYVTNNFVYKLTRRPFNLTANVDSNLNLTSLHWSPPEHADPVASRTITVRLGNITTTILMLLENATLGDSGNYTLTAVNECGRSSSRVDVEVLTDCPLPKFTQVQPSPSFTAVDGYNATLTCSYDGYYSESSPIRVWLKLPNQTPVWLNEVPYPDCNCSVEHRFACSIGTDSNDCCRFELVIHSIPRLDDNGTVFSCNQSYANEYTSWMAVVPIPKVLRAPRNVNVTIGSKAVFICDFQASNDSRISLIHWEFNGTDLAGCRRFQDMINCTVTQSSPDTNYISSTLEIYPVQADNAGQYTCYCSYDTSALNVDGAPTIQSDHKSATLSVLSDSSHGKHINPLLIIVGASVGGAIILAIIIIILFYCCIYHKRHRKGYERLPGIDDPRSPGRAMQVISDEMLDLYVVEELSTYWHKLGKALRLEDDLLQEIYDKSPEDPAERLRIILRKWRDTAENPSLDLLDVILEQLGLKSSIPDRRVVILNSGMVSTSHQIPVGGPGPQIGINRRGRILPGMSNHQAEIKSFQGVLRYGFPPLTVLSPDLQEEWKELGEHMGLQPSLLEQIKQQHSSQTIACCWAVCHYWLNNNMDATWNDLLDKLVSRPLQWNTVASGLYHYLKSLLAERDGAPSNDGRNMFPILQKHYEEIVEHVNPEQLLIQLVVHNLVTPSEQYMMLNPAYPPQKRTQLLLSILPSKDPNTCVRSFYECLRAEKQHSGHEYLADLLEPDIREYENQDPVTNAGPGVSNAAAAVSGSDVTESEINRILPRLKSCWLQVAEMVSAPQVMLNNIITSTEDPEEQARRFFQQFAVYSMKENIYEALDQLGQ